MKYFAKLSSENVVLNVHTVTDENAATEEEGIAFLSKIHKWPYWKQTSKSGNSLRLRPATIGGTYDSVNDIFIQEKPFPSWSLDDNFDWIPPVAKPDHIDNQPPFVWDEDSQSWTQ